MHFNDAGLRITFRAIRTDFSSPVLDLTWNDSVQFVPQTLLRHAGESVGLHVRKYQWFRQQQVTASHHSI